MPLFHTLSLLLATPALASTILGNPNTGATVVATGDPIYIHSIEADRCGGGTQVVSIEETLDKLESTSFTLDTDEFCAVDVKLKWSSSDPIEAVPVSGFTTLKIVSGGAARTIEIDGDDESAALN